jgi:hypothetical protein
MAIRSAESSKRSLQRLRPTALLAQIATPAKNKKALVSEGFSDKQMLDWVGCGGKI